MAKIKCKVCGCEFDALKSDHYVSRDKTVNGLGSVIRGYEECRIYDTFDCPVCGCQSVAQERKRAYDNSAEKETSNNEEDRV